MSKVEVNPAWKIGLEVAYLKKFFPNGVVKSTTKDLVSKIDLQPTPLSRIYKIKIKYKVGCIPEVYVISPFPLPKYSNETELPHMYLSSKQKLCLYYPNHYEWNEKMKIAETLIPWAAEWLFYYEVWLATGKWQGEGIHIGEKNIFIKNRITTNIMHIVHHTY